MSETPHADGVSEGAGSSETAPDSTEREDLPEASEASEPSVEAVQQPVPTTSDPRVDDALSRLAELDSLPLAEQVEVYADIHRRLAGVLSDPDSQA